MSQAVGRMRVRAPSRDMKLGTGFLVCPRLAMTNNHVIGSSQEASGGQIEFNYQMGISGQQLPSVIFRLAADKFFLMDILNDKKEARTVDSKRERSKHEWSVEDYENLYRAAPLLSPENKKELGLHIPVSVYVQDPWVAKHHRDEALAEGKDPKDIPEFAEIYVTREPDLMDGPTSSRIAVVDYDADANQLETPAKWDSKRGVFVFKHNKVQITKDHCDKPQFHQLNVWATIQSILDMYEETWVMGRAAPWAFEGNRLIVVPHAGYMSNAFYDRHSKSLQFYYFGPRDHQVYTCLSHDFIAHETGHAILDGLRPGYIEDSSMQTTAFHEFLADLTAIMSALRNNQLHWAVTELEGDLSKDEIISALAEEFGQYASGRPYLRSAQNEKTICQVKASSSPYDWSEVLTGAMFDILKEMFAKYKTKKDSGSGDPLSPKQAMWRALDRFRRVALQPLDFLPPVDVQFADYARAVLRADELVDPVDENGFRDIIAKVFKNRGIMSVDQPNGSHRPYFYAYDIERVVRSRTDAYHFLNQNRRQLCIPAEQDITVVDLYQTDKSASGEGKLAREIVIQYAWREDVTLNGSEFRSFQGKLVSLLCGGTLVFDSRGNLLSWMHKPGAGQQEPDGRRRRDYCDDKQERGEQRKKELQEYIKGRIERGYVGFSERDRLVEVSLASPVVASQRADGTLRLEVTPHLRHWSAE